MYIDVLGELRVRTTAGEIVVRPGRARTVLLTLLLAAGQRVPSDVLVDRVWGEAAPADPANTLHGVVAYLRRVLGPGVVLTAPGGYALGLPCHSVDSYRFETLVRESQQRAAAGGREALAAAAASLDAALDLWRGPVLAEVHDEHFALPEVVRLEELRYTARELLAQVRLRLDQPGEALPDLRALTAENPLRERAQELLMLALYRSGRQSEALETFRRARLALSAQVGVSPSAALADMHRRILAQDPALAWRAPDADVQDSESAAATEPVKKLPADLRLADRLGSPGPTHKMVSIGASRRQKQPDVRHAWIWQVWPHPRQSPGAAEPRPEQTAGLSLTSTRPSDGAGRGYGVPRRPSAGSASGPSGLVHQRSTALRADGTHRRLFVSVPGPASPLDGPLKEPADDMFALPGTTIRQPLQGCQTHAYRRMTPDCWKRAPRQSDIRPRPTRPEIDAPAR